MKHEKRKLRKEKKVKKNKYKKIMTFTIEIPEEYQEEFIDLLCIGGNYKEYVDDPDEPGEMKLNEVTKPIFAAAQIEIIVFQYVQGQNHRKKETVLRKAQQELAKEETSFDTFLKKEKK